jgi:hypothetical protein
MRGLPLLLLCAPVAFASDPASLHVDRINGRYLSFTLENHYQEPVTKFEVAANFGKNFGCSIEADIKRPEDIHPQGTCGLPIDMETRRVIETNWEVQIVYVEFADGMRWTPQKLTPSRQTAVDACS